MESLLPRQCWSFLHADVPDRADFKTAFAWRTSLHVHRLVLTAEAKPHRRVWKSLLMEIAKRRMKVVTEKSAYIPDTPLLLKK